MRSSPAPLRPALESAIEEIASPQRRVGRRWETSPPPATAGPGQEKGTIVDDQEERELIRRCRGGESGAYEPLVRRHEGWALSYAGAMLGSGDDAADAVQDAFVRAYRGLDGLEDGRPFGPWFRAILRNRCLDELRSARRRREVSREAGRENGRRARGRRGARQPDAPERLEREELGRILRSALEELSPEKRAVLVLREMEEMSYDGIAEELGLSTGTVSSRLHHARRELRRVLEERGFTVEDATT